MVRDFGPKRGPTSNGVGYRVVQKVSYGLGKLIVMSVNPLNKQEKQQFFLNISDQQNCMPFATQYSCSGISLTFLKIKFYMYWFASAQL